MPRCSNPRCGRPGSNTHPEAAPEHSGQRRCRFRRRMKHQQRRWLLLRECPGGIADSPTTVPSARTSPTVPGSGRSGSSSRTPKMVVVESNPGRDARTATIRSCAHSLVELGQRPLTTKPFSAPREWNGRPRRLARILIHQRPSPLHRLGNIPRHDSGPVRNRMRQNPVGTQEHRSANWSPGCAVTQGDANGAPRRGRQRCPSGGSGVSAEYQPVRLRDRRAVTILDVLQLTTFQNALT